MVWFDFSDELKPVSHVGIVEKNLGGGRLQTIEGNTTRNGHGGPHLMFTWWPSGPRRLRP